MHHNDDDVGIMLRQNKFFIQTELNDVRNCNCNKCFTYLVRQGKLRNIPLRVCCFILCCTSIRSIRLAIVTCSLGGYFTGDNRCNEFI